MAYLTSSEGVLVGKYLGSFSENPVLKKLVDEGKLACSEIEEAVGKPGASVAEIEKLLVSRGMGRSEMLRCTSEFYGLPFIEFNESFMLSEELVALVDFEELKKNFWCPLSIRGHAAKVAVFNPADEKLAEEIRRTLAVETVHFVIALPSDIVRIIEHNQDINPHFPYFAGRTPLAKLRTWLASERVLLALHRTTLAKGRTGLAFVRTGLAFISIGLVLLRVFGIGWLALPDAVLIVGGLLMVVDGVRWYLPARKIDEKKIDYPGTEATFGTTVLFVDHSGDLPKPMRTPPIENAQKLRAAWNRLTPVMKRRFLAIDRTDLAEERTILAGFRTRMAHARTGLAFTRTGVSFIGLGIALTKQFMTGLWSIFDYTLVCAGCVMVLEGFRWYISGRSAGVRGLTAVEHVSKKTSIWDFIFPQNVQQQGHEDHPLPFFFNREETPGIWGTTGLALERTLIADRRNVKSRLRTIMARSRTGMAFIRTGSSIFSVGFGLLVYLGGSSIPMVCFNLFLMTLGLAFILDGLYWHIPAERIKTGEEYCTGDVEIPLVDYGKPLSSWKKVVFSHDDL